MKKTAFILLFFLFSTQILAKEDVSKDIPLWYWRQKHFTNFGDHLSLKIVERITRKKIREYNRKPKNNIPKLLALGSILSFGDKNDVIWGSGINGKVLDTVHYLHPDTWDIRSVRGPLTRQYITDKLGVFSCPEVYGDPALLMPRLFPEFKRSKKPSLDYVIVPHYSEKQLFEDKNNPHIVDPTDPWEKVVRKILDSKFVISSSLHGLIVAEAYGIPARFLRVTDKEHLFKYHDYYLGSGRQTFRPAFSVEEALELGGEPPIKIDTAKLYDAFPFDKFTDKNPSTFLPERNAIANHIDLESESMLADFIVDSKKIEIPGFPDAFNPSIIKWNNTAIMSFRTGDSGYASGEELDHEPSFLLSFRRYGPREHSDTNEIGLVFLNENFDPVGKPQLISVDYQDPNAFKSQQDPRLIIVNEQLYMLYSNLIETKEKQKLRRMFLTELNYDGQSFAVSKPVPLLKFDNENEQNTEKNWVPFEYQNQLLLSYSINPHLVFKTNLKTKECETTSNTSSKLEWDFGALRGGTPALKDGNQYVAFFHSSKEMKSLQTAGKKHQHYFMGGYTYSAKPPFALEKISSKPIVGKRFYNGPTHNTWKLLRVVFPAGILLDDEFIWVFYGRQDHEIWVSKLDKDLFYKSLVPVK